MVNKQHQETVKEAVKGKFKRKKSITSKVTPLYPSTYEREYKRVTNGYMKLFDKVLSNHMQEIIDAYGKELRTDARMDSGLGAVVRNALKKVCDEFDELLKEYGLKDKLTKIASMMKNRSVREWKKICKRTLDIELDGDHYDDEDFYGDLVTDWVENGEESLTGVKSGLIASLTDTLLSGVTDGKSITDIKKEVRSECSKSKRAAQAVAVDSVTTLNSNIAKLIQTDSGCKKYMWKTCGDGRVRACHAELEGKIFNWDDPPEMWYETKSGIVYTGRYCNPGEDYNCRCTAVPVFEWDTVDVPIEE